MMDWSDFLTSWLMALSAIGAVAVAYWQLRNLDNTLKTNGLMAVLQLEAEMNSRNLLVNEASNRIRSERANENPNREYILAQGDLLESYVENWLNAADRLAYCIREGYLAERDWKREYRPYFQNLVKTHESKFGPGTLYRNILHLNNKWHDE